MDRGKKSKREGGMTKERSNKQEFAMYEFKVITPINAQRAEYTILCNPIKLHCC